VTSKPDFKVMVLLLVFMQLTRDLFAIAKFLLTCVRRLTYVIDRLDVCLCVCPSVTRWYYVKTAQPIVKLSSLPSSPMIVVFSGPNLFPGITMGTPSTRALNTRG